MNLALRLGLALLVLAGVGAFMSSIGQVFRVGPLAAVPLIVWVPIAVSWIVLVLQHRGSSERLWRLPTALFRGGILAGVAAILAVHGGLLLAAPPEMTVIRRLFLASLNAALYELGIVLLASLAAFALSRSLLRPALVNTRPPPGARDITLRTRFVVATTGALLVDFELTPDETLESFLAIAFALVAFAAIIGWLVGDDAARGVEAVTRRIRELSIATEPPREMPVIAADEVGDLALAANELERRMRRDEAVSAARGERERVARELHDGVAKSVSVLALEASALAHQADPEMRRRLGRIEHLARVLAEELRAIVQEVRANPGDMSFEQLLRGVAEKHPGAAFAFEGDLDRADTLARFETLRILEEALRNAERHADATHVTALVAVADGQLRLEVQDDGKGIGELSWEDLADSGHFGLVGMRERAALLDGDLRLERRATGGTRVVVELPLRRERDR